MSKYESLCVAIELCESARKIFPKGTDQKDATSEVIRDLQDIAKDVRYGGKWDGDFEVIAEMLGHCAENECPMCVYRKLNVGCSTTLKKDAAAAIRAMGKKEKE